MWTKGVKHRDRMILAAFMYFNGLNPEVFFDWAKLVNLCKDDAAEREFRSIFKAFSQGIGYNVYAYVVAHNRYEYLDGRVRYYKPRDVRKGGATNE